MQDIMGNMDIAFPNLGIYLRDVPKSFSVFGFTIALYGVIIAIGVLGGVLLGVIETFANAYISTELSDAVVFAVLIVVLLVRPAGLLGKYVPEKV